MSNREVILSARGDAAHIELIHEGQRLILIRNGEPMPEGVWEAADVRAATEAFHRLIQDEGLI